MWDLGCRVWSLSLGHGIQAVRFGIQGLKGSSFGLCFCYGFNDCVHCLFRNPRVVEFAVCDIEPMGPTVQPLAMESQRLKYPLMRVYTLIHVRDPTIKVYSLIKWYWSLGLDLEGAVRDSNTP